MEWLCGICFMSLQVVKDLLPILFLGRILYHFTIFHEWRTVVVKGIALLIAIALVVGMPLGLIELAYPSETKAFEKP